MGKIKAINISNLDGENTFYVNQAVLMKNKGIINDRYYENFKNNYEQVTLIESEKIDNFNMKTSKKIDYKDFRRNIITSGIDLNKTINKRILINKSGVRAEIVQSGVISTFDKIKIII